MGQAECAISVCRFQIQRNRLVVGRDGVVVTPEIEICLAEIQVGFSIIGAQLDCLLIRFGGLIVFAAIEEIVSLL